VARRSDPICSNFYRSIGVNLKQLYGMTETCVTVSMHSSGEVSSSRRPADAGRRGAHRRLGRSPGALAGVMRRYTSAPRTREAIDAEGFFHTGDAGYFDRKAT